MNDFLEKDLEDIIVEKRYDVFSRGFCDLSWGNLERQSKLTSGKIIDILVFQEGENLDFIKFNIIELKRGEVDLTALLQAAGYYAEMSKIAADSYQSSEISVTLCGRYISPSVVELAKMMNCVELYEYNYTFDGLFFKKVPTKIELKVELENEILISSLN